MVDFCDSVASERLAIHRAMAQALLEQGAAYRDYFSTDRLMFKVSKTDTRLRNKAEVLVMQFHDTAAPDHRVPVAIDTKFLRKHPVYTFALGNERVVVVTSKNGANRV